MCGSSCSSDRTSTPCIGTVCHVLEMFSFQRYFSVIFWTSVSFIEGYPFHSTLNLTDIVIIMCVLLNVHCLFEFMKLFLDYPKVKLSLKTTTESGVVS